MKMENGILKASRRKKRRTRKNLDEIKKRTLQGHNNNNNENIIRHILKPKYTNYITNSRLILAKKAIRSETVTRSVLSNLDEESKNNMIVLPNTEVIDTLVSNVNYKKGIIPFKANSNLKSPLCHYKEVDTYQTPVSIILFSSPAREKVIKSTVVSDVLSDSSSSASLNSLMQNENSLYNEFMANVLDYVQESASDYFKTDIVPKYQNSFIANIIQNIIYNKNKDIADSQSMNEHDIKDKSFFTGNDERISEYHKCQSNINKQYLLRNVPKPVFCQSHVINLQRRTSSGNDGSSGRSSPEYLYYPHRLN